MIHAALDAIWAIAVGDIVGTMMTQVDHYAAIISLDLVKEEMRPSTCPRRSYPLPDHGDDNHGC